MKNLLLAAIIILSPTLTFASELLDKLQDVSVTIRTDRGSGSGVIRTRKVGDDNISFVITAAHVINNLKEVGEDIDVTTGQVKKIVEYKDCEVVKTLIEDGRTVGHTSLSAKPIKVSKKEDLAVLMIRKKNFTKDSAQIYLDAKIPSLGEDVWNVGSALGVEGSNTVSKGLVSQVGRLLNGKVYDQYSCPAFPGCSGSGIFLNDGRLVSILTNGAGETYILGVPSRRLVWWAKKEKIEWVVNDKVNMPSQTELDKIPVE